MRLLLTKLENIVPTIMITPPNVISFLPDEISEFVCLLFLQDHRKTERFFAVSGVQRTQHDRDCSRLSSPGLIIEKNSREELRDRYTGPPRPYFEVCFLTLGTLIIK
jgi:hypothetical protein